MKTVKERIKLGKSRRNVVHRVAQSQFRPKDRKFDPIEVLLSSTVGRLPELMPLKYLRMSSSPFAFFRGAVSIMAADLAQLPHCGLNVQLCGDAHVQNMGSFASPDGKLIFDVNDFDETIRGPWEWDVKRMATSIILAGRAAKQNRSVRKAASEAFVETYCHWMGEFSSQPILDVARHIIHRQKGARPIHAALLQSKRARSLDVLKKYMKARGKEYRFRDLRPVGWRVTGSDARQVLESLKKYHESLASEPRHLFDFYRPIDVGFKVVGTGSVGLRDYVVLLEGNGPRDPLFLQIKQEVMSAYAAHVPECVYEHQGRRAAEGQKAIQPLSDVFLGWTSFAGHEYLVRQFHDHKGTIDLKTLKDGGLQDLAVVAGELLARGHARTGDMCAIEGYCGGGSKIVKAIRDFASAYADQTEADYGKFMVAARNGKIKLAKDDTSG
jgi:uncharacterized protein (DUF2252 family)